MVDPDGLEYDEKEKDEDGDQDEEIGKLFGISFLITRAIIAIMLGSSMYIAKALKSSSLRQS